MNRFYGEKIPEDIIGEPCPKSKCWMSAEHDERVLDYWKKPNAEYIVKQQQHEGLERGTLLKNTMLTHLGSCIVNNGKRTMNIFIREVDVCNSFKILYTGTNTFYFEKKDLGFFN